MRKILYSPPALIAYSIGTLIALFFSLPQFNLLLYPFNIIGILIAILGLILMGIARKLFKKHKTPLILDTSSYLIKEGVFSKSRNPMYLGMLLVLVGISIFSTNIFALVTPIVFFGLIKYIYIKKEEKMLTETFGEEYLAYKKIVRRWI